MNNDTLFNMKPGLQLLMTLEQWDKGNIHDGTDDGCGGAANGDDDNDDDDDDDDDDVYKGELFK